METIFSTAAIIIAASAFVFICLFNKTIVEQLKELQDGLNELHDAIYKFSDSLNKMRQASTTPEPPKEVNEKPQEKPQEKPAATIDSKLSPIERADKNSMCHALEKHHGDMKKAAEYLRIPYNTFYNKMTKYKLYYLVKARPSGRAIIKERNMEKFTELREQGYNFIEAAEILKVSVQTASKYEVEYLKNKTA